MFSINRLHLYVFAGVWLLVHALVFYKLGIREQLFDSQVYINAADFFLSHGSLEKTHHVFYALPILIIAFFKTFPGGAITGYVVFQCFVSGIAGLCLYRAAALLFRDQNAGLISAVIFLCWWDVIQWNTAVMTESIACSITCVVILSLAKFQGSVKDYVVLFLLLMLSILTRPTGVLVIVAALSFVITWNWDSVSRTYLKILLVAGFAVMAVGGISLMSRYWDLTKQYPKGNIVTYMDTMEGHRLYQQNLRLDTSGLMLPDPERSPLSKMLFFMWHNPIHFTTAAGLKIFYLLTATRPYFSSLHNTYAIVWLSIIYALFIFGVSRAGNAAIKYFCISMIGANCLLIAVATVDWDNRFYVPMQPAFALLAGGGGAYCIQHLLRTRR